MNKRRGKKVKLEHFNASKNQKHMELSEYVIIYNTVLLYVPEVI